MFKVGETRETEAGGAGDKERWESVAKRFEAVKNALQKINSALLYAGGDKDIPECLFCLELMTEHGPNGCDYCAFAKVFGRCSRDEDQIWRSIKLSIGDAIKEAGMVVEAAQIDVCPSCGKTRSGKAIKLSVYGFCEVVSLTDIVKRMPMVEKAVCDNWFVYVLVNDNGSTVIDFADSPNTARKIRAALLNVCPDCGQPLD